MSDEAKIIVFPDPRERKHEDAPLDNQTFEVAEPLDLALARDRRRMENILFFIDAFSEINDQEFEGPQERSHAIATMHFDELVEMTQANEPLLEALRQNQKGVEACKRLAARRIAIGWAMDDRTRHFLNNIGGLPSERDISRAEEAARPKSAWERQQDRVGGITGKLLRALYPGDEPLPKDGLSVIDVHPIVEYTLKAAEKDKDERAYPLDKAIPREWVVSAVEAAIQRKPNCEDNIWKIVRFLWDRYGISDFENIEADVFKRLKRPTERDARSKAGEMLFTWMDDIASGRQDERTVMEWMLNRYRYNFEGTNQPFGDLFGYVYLEEVIRATEQYNQFLSERRAAIEEKELAEGLDVHDRAEKQALERTVALDRFFIKRLTDYFRTKGVILKTAKR